MDCVVRTLDWSAPPPLPSMWIAEVGSLFIVFMDYSIFFIVSWNLRRFCLFFLKFVFVFSNVSSEVAT